MGMQLFLRAQQTHTLEVTGTETVNDVKNHISQLESLPAADLVIYAAGQPISDEEALSSFDDMTTLDVELRLLGGKVHGSLARAGKVKGQTPKVEKQEKKKKRT